MKWTFFISLLFIFLSSMGYAEDKENYLIVPGICVGTITEKTTELDLIDLYGIENVRSTTSINDQNVRTTETIVFPFDTLKQLHVFWTDGNPHQGPDFIRIEGSSTLWHTADDITLGTSLIDLGIMNGTFFYMTGFNLVNPGEITDCGYGKLKYLGYRIPDEEGIKGKSIILRLDQPDKIYSRVTPTEYQSICKDGVFQSDNKVLEKLNPVVRQIDVMFP